MQKVTCEAMDEAYTTFAVSMGHDQSSWKALFEFSFFTEFGLLNVARDDVRKGKDLDVSDRTAKFMAMLRGPYADTIIRAYRCKRYSFLGKLRAFCLYPIFVALFLCCFVIAVVKDIFE